MQVQTTLGAKDARRRHEGRQRQDGSSTPDRKDREVTWVSSPWTRRRNEPWDNWGKGEKWQRAWQGTKLGLTERQKEARRMVRPEEGIEWTDGAKQHRDSGARSCRSVQSRLSHLDFILDEMEISWRILVKGTGSNYVSKGDSGDLRESRP